MAKLEYTFKTDTLFKMLFVKYPELLKRLVSVLLNIPVESIGTFRIQNPEIPPETLGDKFCRLDINMTVDGLRVDLEIQVADEGDYPDRSLYYWAREYSASLEEGREYSNLPRVVIINIVDFKIFECPEFHSEFQALEVARHTPLTDKMSLHYFELPKLPERVRAEGEQGLWLYLFKAETEEDLKEIEILEVPIMKEVINAYRSITGTDEFKEIERLRSLARHNEASALGHARRQERAKWQAALANVVAQKDAALANVVAQKDAEIERLRAELGKTE